MSGWQPRSVAGPAAPAKSPLELSSDDDETPPDVPPPEFFIAARALAPTSTRRDALRAWDETRQDGAPSAGEAVLASASAQAALGALIDLIDPPAAASASTAANATMARKRAASPSLRLAHSSPDTPPQPKRARTGTPGHQLDLNGEGKGKGKGKAVYVLDSDDEPDQVVVDDSLEVVSPLPARRLADKGKGRAHDYRELLVLDSDDEDADPGSLAEQPPSPLATVLAVLPDVDPGYVSELLDAPEHAAGGAASVVELLLGMKTYPRVDDGGEGDGEGARQDKGKGKEKEVDWLDVDARKNSGEQPTPLYKKIALDQLYTDFDRLPSTVIKQSFVSAPHACFFAPTWTTLRRKLTAGEYDNQKLKKARKPPKPVVRIVRRERDGEEWDEEEVEGPPPELKREMDWLVNKIVTDRAARRAADEEERAADRERKRAERLNEKAREAGTAIECGCCYDEVAVENTASCVEGHLFCKSCALANASDRIGRRQAVLPCMTADCSARFDPKSYPSFLAPKMVDSLAALAQQKDLDEAFDGVEGFEKCPFCPFACLIENPDERLFRCERPECRKVSCRKCRKEGHVPLSCEEADEESRLPGVHAVAEAMSAALIRPCPKCTVPCLKSDGCNKMVCSQCGAYWCYCCRAIIKGYEHFEQRAGSGDGKCVLHDDTEMADYNQIEQARLRAQDALDARTAADAARLAAAKPVRAAPIYPVGHPLAAPAAAAPPLAPAFAFGAVRAAAAAPAPAPAFVFGAAPRLGRGDVDGFMFGAPAFAAGPGPFQFGAALGAQAGGALFQIGGWAADDGGDRPARRRR
ncbi:hypothetical protein JCM3775_007195 [Rhodotorula graminis]|uniref:RING-type domain-containing protein n=1 Tax=Rhodotorula graminis (strain WP1) TaxID=578459 RepID=A0A0P9F0D1_RHOGW|nr:uncharacterized protein RHOBADRAFT_46529 [Rhodotorula graminis WP1]KPV72938.1 hypothetical protein RHOBADRAFT_46529 [Rhodotorula graminis WP1]